MGAVGNRTSAITAGLADLKPKEKVPNSASNLEKWIIQAESKIQGCSAGRLAWLVASTVVTAKLQQVLDEDDNPRFVLKGGTLLQHRLGLESRATKDLDGIVRGDIDAFLADLDSLLGEDWGPISFSRSQVEIVNVLVKAVKPRSFSLSLSLKGKVWRTVKVEISPDEGMAGSTTEQVVPPSLVGLGLPTPDALVGLAMSYQAAQKIHASTRPGSDRARDLADLIGIMRLAQETGSPTLHELRLAVIDIFAAREEEAAAVGRQSHPWPARYEYNPAWEIDFARAATDIGIEMMLAEAVDVVNGWLDEIESA